MVLFSPDLNKSYVGSSQIRQLLSEMHRCCMLRAEFWMPHMAGKPLMAIIFYSSQVELAGVFRTFSWPLPVKSSGGPNNTAMVTGRTKKNASAWPGILEWSGATSEQENQRLSVMNVTWNKLLVWCTQEIIGYLQVWDLIKLHIDIYFSLFWQTLNCQGGEVYILQKGNQIRRDFRKSLVVFRG